MTGAFGWLNSLLTTFGKLFPRLVLVRATHRGVLFRWSGAFIVLEPGLRWYWPVTTDIRLVLIVTRAWDINPVTVEHGFTLTSWGEFPWALRTSATIQVRITDVRKAITLAHFQAAVENATTAAICNLWPEGVAAIRQRIEEDCAAWGITVVDFALIDTGRTLAIGAPQRYQSHTEGHTKSDSAEIDP